ncbi:tryptophan synthase subunit alpha [Candidatus Nitrosocosmicus hydrocola]|uniref:tryptophan synthase subunit alpha n=1 Tax=Candidatus Nitrosocosmicus hydrocola TaxID=1826872 RepID=UPI001372D3D9|nr:tryptophan synthase subunit alpha [Candidatus Nitrosocosmicus hydrocola]
MNNKVALKFSNLEKRKEKALITYLVGGFPDLITSRQIIETVIESGADIVEIGIPFSDPMADGPIIQQAFSETLQNGIRPVDCLHLINSIKTRYDDTPIVVMTYSNILYANGLNKFLKLSKNSNIDGFIVPDLNFQEADDFLLASKNLGLATIFLTSPNTNLKRLAKICTISTGFVYMVSVYGITGSRNRFEKYTFDSIKKTKAITTKHDIPLAVGFGISTPSDGLKMIQAGADGIIVGSSLIKIIQQHKDDKDTMLKNLGLFVKQLKKVCYS